MQFRVARHTSDFRPIVNFYVNLMGLEIMGDFKGHNNYDGIFIGKPDLNWHLEFTKSETPAIHTSDDDDMLVFYPDTVIEYNEILSRFQKLNILAVIPKNPYWIDNGTTFTDPDGFNVVISPLKTAQIQ